MAVALGLRHGRFPVVCLVKEGASAGGPPRVHDALEVWAVFGFLNALSEGGHAIAKEGRAEDDVMRGPNYAQVVKRISSRAWAAARLTTLLLSWQFVFVAVKIAIS